MITRVEKVHLSRMLDLYQAMGGHVTITEDLVSDLLKAFSHPDARMIFQESGFIVLMPYNKTLTINPWFLDGLPIGKAEGLIEEAIAYFDTSPYQRLELLSSQPYKGLLAHYYDYVDMTLNLKTYGPQAHIQVAPLATIPVDILKAMFHEAFSQGDAVFYKLLTEEERHKFWQYLEYDQCVQDEASLAIYADGNLAGFAMVMPYGTLNKHITCMLILPKYQRRGLGKGLMLQIMYLASKSGCETLSLGTEASMAAYKLYKLLGFEDVHVKHHYYRLK